VFARSNPGPVTCWDWYNTTNLPPWQGEARLGSTFTDGTSQTIMLGEKFASCYSDTVPRGGNMWARWDCADYFQPVFGAWVSGPASKFQVRPFPANSSACNYTVAQTAHAAMTTAFADGSVRGLTDSISGPLWWALCTPAGGEVVGDYY